MHYNSVRDAVWGTTMVILTGFFRPDNISQAFLIYNGVFLVMALFLEAAREWQQKRRKKMGNLVKECTRYIREELQEGHLSDEDSRLMCALAYLANDEDVRGLYELIKTGKAPGAGKQSGT